MKSRKGKNNTKTSHLRTHISVFKRVLWLTLFLSLTACLPQPETPFENNTSTPITPSKSPTLQDITIIPSQTSQPEDPSPERSERLEIKPTKNLEQVPTLPKPETGEVPEDILGSILSDLAKREDVNPDGIQVIRAEAVRWSDGSLGCPQPDISYTHEPINGYWVVLQIEGVDYDYRASESGYFTLCEGSRGIIPPPGENPPKQ